LSLKITSAIILIVFLFSCNKKESKKTLNETQTEQRIVAIKDKINDSIFSEKEFIITKNDSFLNQLRIYKNGVLDTLNSSFFDLKILTNNGTNHSGQIYYRHFYDTLNLEINKKRFVLLYLEQQTEKDSIVKKVFMSEDGNNIYYDYSDFQNGYISGYINDTALIFSDQDTTENSMARHLEQNMNIQLRLKNHKP